LLRTPPPPQPHHASARHGAGDKLLRTLNYCQGRGLRTRHCTGSPCRPVSPRGPRVAPCRPGPPVSPRVACVAPCRPGRECCRARDRVRRRIIIRQRSRSRTRQRSRRNCWPGNCWRGFSGGGGILGGLSGGAFSGGANPALAHGRRRRRRPLQGLSSSAGLATRGAAKLQTREMRKRIKFRGPTHGGAAGAAPFQGLKSSVALATRGAAKR
jgi:hypothetical protein